MIKVKNNKSITDMMNRNGILLSILYSVFFIGFLGCDDQSITQKPIVFEPGKISTELVEFSSTFSSSGNEVYFARSHDKWGSRNSKSSIFYSIKENQQWSSPVLVSFSGQYDDSGPHITNDGKAMYFISERPVDGILEVSPDIWKVERNDMGIWGAPMRLSNPTNSSKSEYSPRTDDQGNLYFASTREGGFGQGDIYVAKKERNGFGRPENLGEAINSEMGEWNLEINKDGSIIIFEASQREENLSPYGDLYISFKMKDQWSVAQHIEEINTTGSDLYPELIEDQDVLFYTSSDSLTSPNTDIYYIGFRSIYDRYIRTAVVPTSH